MKASLAVILKRWLENNEGWHNKAKLTRMEWYYHNSHKMYSTDTVGRALREASEQGLILKRETVKGQVEYSGKKKVEYYVDPITRTARRI